MTKPTPEFTITIDPKQDVLDLSQGKLIAGKASPPGENGFKGYAIKPGFYEVTYSSNVTYHDKKLPVKKCVIYNTTNSQEGGWFYVIDEGPVPQIIHVDADGYQSGFIWAFVIDIYSSDNEGKGTVTIKPCS